MPEREIKVIREISQIISRATDYAEGLRQTMACIAKHMHVDACTVFVQDRTDDMLVLAATSGLDQELVGNFRLAADEGITGQCFHRRTLVNCRDMHQHPGYHPFVTTAEVEYRGLLAVPLVVGGRVIGVLDLARRKRRRKFSQRSVSAAKSIAAPLAVFLHNAQLSRHVKAAARHAATVDHAHLLLHGTPISDGVVRGRAYFVAGAEVIEGMSVEYAKDPEQQHRLLRKALQIAREDTLSLQREAGAILAEADAAIFYAHLLLLEDPTLLERIKDAIDQGYTIKFALKLVTRQFVEELESLDNEVMRERIADMKDVILRIFEAVESVEGRARKSEKVRRHTAANRPVAVARELLPSQLVRLPLANLAGIVCEQGGTTSHAAILARALRLPMIAGVQHATVRIHRDDPLLLDCTTGCCYVRPSADTITRFRPALSYRKDDKQPASSEPTPALTSDGTPIRVGGNISLISEMPLLRQYGAMGVGLYRTEFMFMIRGVFPSEDEQYDVFRRVVEGAGGPSVCIRVLDVGGDKPLSYVDFSQETNPYLGWRGTRFLLANPQYLEPHLRAILRAAAHGHVNLLFPMVADLDELMEVREVLATVETDLRRSGVIDEPSYHVGIMLEVPSAIWSLPAMLPHLDFVSIGTNDLIQYTFAVDRGNSKVSRWYRQFHPIVLRMIKETCDIVSQFPDRNVSLCGEVAGIPAGIPLLLGAGLRYLSMNPWRIPQARETIQKVTLDECNYLLEQATRYDRDQDVMLLIREFADAHGLAQTRDAPDED